MIICSTCSIIIMLINYNDENNDESNNNNLLRLLPLLLHRHRRHRHFDQDRSWFLVARSSRSFDQDRSSFLVARSSRTFVKTKHSLLCSQCSILSATLLPPRSKVIPCCKDLRWVLHPSFKDLQLFVDIFLLPIAIFVVSNAQHWFLFSQRSS